MDTRAVFLPLGTGNHLTTKPFPAFRGYLCSSIRARLTPENNFKSHMLSLSSPMQLNKLSRMGNSQIKSQNYRLNEATFMTPLVGPAIGDVVRQFKRVQNGSDIRGIAIDGVPNEPVTLTPGIVYFVGTAFAEQLYKNKGSRVVVAIGRDPRLSGPLLESALYTGLMSGGADVKIFGLATTPSMFQCIVDNIEVDDDGEVEVDGSVMITASHMPFNANGLKFFTEKGGLEKKDISALLQRAAQLAAEQGAVIGNPLDEMTWLMAYALDTPSFVLSGEEYLPQYAKFLRSLIIERVADPDNPLFPLLGTKFTVNAGNGAGGFFATQVLAPLGADVSSSLYLEPDGTFPNHPPNPESPAAMAVTSDAVIAAVSDLGIVFDTDVDRSGIVERNGRAINSNAFIALMAAIVLREHPGSTIVTDSVTSNGLTEFITRLGGKHFRYMRGYKNVISKGVELNKQGTQCELMMETSGHGALKENHFLDDGAYAVVKIIIEMVRARRAGSDIVSLIADLKEPVESREFRIKIQDRANFKAVAAIVLSKFYEWLKSGMVDESWSLEPVNHEGWRVVVDEGEGKKGWLLLRSSLHDPLLVLNVESEVKGGVSAAAVKLLAFFQRDCSELPLDISPLDL